MTPLNNFETRWDKNNVIFRSSVWNSEGLPISLSFKKFFNWGERSDLFPVPTKSEECCWTEKIDGSTLIVSKYKGQLITRTRGCLFADKHEKAGHEIEYFKKKYPLAFEFKEDTAPFSLIYEWTTPNNKIVIDYGNEPLLWMIAIIYHGDYSLRSQSRVWNSSSTRLVNYKKPLWFKNLSLAEIIQKISTFEGREGVCCYSENGIHKIKSTDYLKKWHFKSNATLDSVLDLFISLGYPTLSQFREHITKEFDYECLKVVEEHVERVCTAYMFVLNRIREMKIFINLLKGKPRKEAATEIINTFPGFQSFAFIILDNREFSAKEMKKFLLNYL